MAHFAKLDNTCTVIGVFPGNENETELELIIRTGDTYRRTSYNTSGGVHYTNGEPSADQSKAFRKNFAGIGYRYDVERDAFIPPKTRPSWVLNETTCLWEPPVAMPDDGQLYTWNETEQRWDVMSAPE